MLRNSYSTTTGCCRQHKLLKHIRAFAAKDKKNASQRHMTRFNTLQLNENSHDLVAMSMLPSLQFCITIDSTSWRVNVNISHSGMLAVCISLRSFFHSICMRFNFLHTSLHPKATEKKNNKSDRKTLTFGTHRVEYRCDCRRWLGHELVAIVSVHFVPSHRHRHLNQRYHSHAH